MEEAYVIGVICMDEPDKIAAVRKDSPLIVGLGEGENFIASDILALLKYTRNMYLIENDEVVLLTKDKVTIFNSMGQEMEREIFEVTWDAETAEKDGYDHFMIKVIHEQPKGVSETLLRRLDKEDNIVIDGIKLTKEDLDNIIKYICSLRYCLSCGISRKIYY